MKNYELVCNGESGNQTLEEEVAKQFVEAFELWKVKQHSYGSSNISAFMEMGVLVRVSDKVARLRNMIVNNKEERLADESIMDTWIDIVNYGVIARLCRIGVWPKS